MKHHNGSTVIDKNGNVDITFIPPPPGSSNEVEVTTMLKSLEVNGQSIPTTPGITSLPDGVEVQVVGVTLFGLPFNQVIVTEQLLPC
jgi:hypothetical protein